MTAVELSSRDICRATGLTYRQLDKWVTLGWLPSSVEGSGYARTFPVELVQPLRRLREFALVWNMRDTTWRDAVALDIVGGSTAVNLGRLRLLLDDGRLQPTWLGAQ